MMTQHYKDSNNKLYGYKPTDIDVTAITIDEAREIASFKTPPQLAETARVQRDALLDQIAWRYERNASELRLGIEATDSIELLDQYAQALRDITNQKGFPAVIDWPETP